VSQSFTEEALRIIAAIPPGKVATYGGIAAMAGDPRGARQVVRILSSMSKKMGLPWHRVLRKDGSIALPSGGGLELQRALLEVEGIPVDEHGRVDLAHCLWRSSL
jgi:methylated-DNA-protein-cysteine methyltransferase-like protein